MALAFVPEWEVNIVFQSLCADAPEDLNGDAAFVRILKLSFVRILSSDFVRMGFYRVLTLSEWVFIEF